MNVTSPREIGLFVPCYVDQLSPEVGWATVRILEHLGHRVHYDPEQTCCGQPFLNMGAAKKAAGFARAHLERFSAFDTIVCPSGSCVATVRHRFPELGVGAEGDGARQRAATYELGEFLVDELGTPDLGARFPHSVAVLQSCHGLRDLGLGPKSEAGPDAAPTRSVIETLLDSVDGLEQVRTGRPDDCCGFGGTFAVKYPEVSTRMGRARLEDSSEAEFVTGTDVSCLLHLEGIRAHTGTGPKPIHLAEILASGLDAAAET
jgi:L-lactate dehydrogenase complex protein LldE